MRKIITTRTFAIGLLLVGALGGIAGAQVDRSVTRARYINTGLFSVASDEGVSFHVTLDDHRGAPPAKIALRLIDQTGAVVVQEHAVLQPGQSTTLRSIEPGVYRAQARILDPLRRLSDRRSVVSTVEIFDVNLGFAAVRRFICAPPEVDPGNKIPQG
ncbi:MAG: hypothetical protein GEV06_25535 [Luteitalea sp.]|nr:hypothetical protein [Luteitalea sp.]